MKNKIIVALSIILVILLGFTYFNTKSLNTKYENAVTNYKALALSKDILSNTCIQYQFKVNQLSYYTDSLILKMDSLRKSLGIKDKQLKEMGYVKTVISKTDTISFKDTIFVDNLCLDTVIQDQWYQLNLSLTYPDEICIEPTFKSEMHLNTYVNKETIEKPRKFFLFRLFQKKHYVTKVTVTEDNPYIKIQDKIFINVQ